MPVGGCFPGFFLFPESATFPHVNQLSSSVDGANEFESRRSTFRAAGTPRLDAHSQQDFLLGRFKSSYLVFRVRSGVDLVLIDVMDPDGAGGQSSQLGCCVYLNIVVGKNEVLTDNCEDRASGGR